MRYHMPAETPRSERGRFFDWRFLSALAALLFIGFLCWAGFRNYELREAEAAQKDALIADLANRSDEIRELNERISFLQETARAERQRAADERHEARRERAKLLRQQARMIHLLQRLRLLPNVVVREERDGATPRPRPSGHPPVTSSPPAPRAPVTREPRAPRPEPKPKPDPKPAPPKGPGPKDPDPPGPGSSLLDDLLNQVLSL